VHFQFEANGILQKEQLSFFKPFFLQVNTRTGKIFFKYLRYTHNNVRRILNRMAFKLPPADIRHKYEKDKLAFTTSLNKSILEQSNGRREKHRDDAHMDRKIMIKSLMVDGKKPREIAEITGIPRSTVHRIMNVVTEI